MLEQLRKAMNLSETATAAEVRETFNRILQDTMTPEERAKAKKEEEEAKKEEKEMAGFKAFRTRMAAELGLAEDATDDQIVDAIKKKKKVDDEKEARELTELTQRNTKLEIEVKKLTDSVEALKPQAALAEKLDRDLKATEKSTFFDRQLREGKLLPAERAFWEGIWDKDRSEVEKYFKDKKPNIHLAERGLGGQGESHEDEDPRAVLAEKAEKLAAEKGITLNEALDRVKAAEPGLVKAIGGLYGAEGVRR